MKKQDMIDRLTATFEYVEGITEHNLDPILWPPETTRQVYIAQVFTLQNEKMVKKGYPFVVFNEGQVGEEAFWMSSGDPVPPVPEPTFQSEMLAWLHSKLGVQVGPYIICHIESTTANNTTRTGTANVIVEDGAGDHLRKSALVWKDAQDEFQFQIIKE